MLRTDKNILKLLYRASSHMAFIVDQHFEDAYQTCALVNFEMHTEEKQDIIRTARASLERLARQLGWHRWREGSQRRWAKESPEIWLTRPGYRRSSGDRKRAARMKVPTKKRKVIAQMGGKARNEV